MNKKSPPIDIATIQGVAEASFADPFTHGLDPEERSFQARLEGTATNLHAANSLCDVVWLNPPSDDDGAWQHEIISARRALHERMIGWAEYVEYCELGAPLLLASAPAASSDDSANATKHAPRGAVKSPQQVGMLNLTRVFAEALEREVNLARAQAGSDDKSLAHQHLHDAHALAHAAVREYLPTQAFMILPPDELMHAKRDAEKIAKDAFDMAKKFGAGKSAQVGQSPLQQVKHRIEQGIKTLRQRHDARMQSLPISAPHATGIGTLAIIASQQQSLTNTPASTPDLLR